jgi:hypothetical protein
LGWACILETYYSPSPLERGKGVRLCEGDIRIHSYINIYILFPSSKINNTDYLGLECIGWVNNVQPILYDGKNEIDMSCPLCR